MWVKSIDFRITGILILGLICFISSCSGDKSKNIPDVSGLKIQLDVKRFEKELFALDTNNIKGALKALESRYPVFYEIYFDQVLGFPRKEWSPDSFGRLVVDFITNADVLELKDSVEVQYGDFSRYKGELEHAFRYYKHYFPSRPIPKVVTCISGLNIAAFTVDSSTIGIGLDMFLGKGFKGYVPSIYPYYVQHHMNKDHLTARAVEAFVQDMTGAAKGDRLIDEMVHEGKKWYLLDALLPEYPDSAKWQVSGIQVQWLEENQANIWAHLTSEQLLYSIKRGDWRKLVEISPGSPGMPKEAPGRTGTYIGYLIVRDYMDRHPSTSMEQLLAIKDAQKLLTESKFKPKK